MKVCPCYLPRSFIERSCFAYEERAAEAASVTVPQGRQICSQGRKPWVGEKKNSFRSAEGRFISKSNSLRYGRSGLRASLRQRGTALS